MVQQELLNLGLGEKEAEVYLACLQLGYATVSNIAEKAEINRTTAYTHIRNLISRGLIARLDKNGRQFFVAEKPQRLKYYYEQQEQEIKRRQESLSRIMPELESLYGADEDRPSVRFYGQDNLQALRKEIIDSRSQELCCIYNHAHFNQNLNKGYISELLDNVSMYRKLYIAAHKTLDRRLHGFIGHERFAVRYLPLAKFNCLCELVVNDRQVFIARQNDSLIIKDNLFSQTLKILFGVLWGLAEEF